MQTDSQLSKQIVWKLRSQAEANVKSAKKILKRETLELEDSWKNMETTRAGIT